ncbi:MAG: glycosyltransferase [Burkholderiales bacterium]
MRRSWRPHQTLGVVILTRNEADNLRTLLPALADVLAKAGVVHDVVVVDADSPDGTADVARQLGATVVSQRGAGYANALRQGLACGTGDYLLTLDADLSHRPEFVVEMLDRREDADIVIASRYVDGGRAVMPLSRRALSRVLNSVYAGALGLPVRDLSSGFRLYRRSALAALAPRGEHFDVLPEILAQAVLQGMTVREVPFAYQPRVAGLSKARALAFAPSYVRTLVRCMAARRRHGKAGARM